MDVPKPLTWHTSPSKIMGGGRGVKNFRKKLLGSVRKIGKVSPALFWKIEKSCPDFGKNARICDHLWVKILSKDAALGVSRRKKSYKFFPGGPSIHVLMKCLLKYPYFKRPPVPRKIHGCTPSNLYVRMYVLKIPPLN